jgi:hypothetical protein
MLNVFKLNIAPEGTWVKGKIEHVQNIQLQAFAGSSRSHWRPVSKAKLRTAHGETAVRL